MNAKEIYDAIQTGNRQDAQQALFGLLAHIQTLTIATLEVAGDIRVKSGRDPLASGSRLILSEFLQLPKEQN